jgi:DNA-binding transcriptional MerR regulator
MDRTYRIGEFARLGQTSVKTLRHYARIGLLRPAYVEPRTGYRHYGADQLTRLNRILAYKELGFALRDVLILLEEPERSRELVERRRKELVRERERVEARLALLDLVGPYRIAVRDVPSRPIASVREKLASHDECDALLAELENSRGTRGAVWHACAPRAIDCEAFVLVDGDRGARELPACRVASLVYDGDYPAAYEAMRAWIRASRHRVAGPKLEIFHGATATEIQFPITRACA